MIFTAGPGAFKICLTLKSIKNINHGAAFAKYPLLSNWALCRTL